MQHVAHVVPRRPGPVGSGHIGAMIEYAQLVPIGRQRSIPPQLGTHGFVDLAAAAIVGRDDDGVFGLRRIVSGNRGDAFIGARDFRHPTLFGEQRNAFFGFVIGKQLDRAPQLRVILAHDLVELRGPHPGLLHLLEGPTGIDRLMLAGVADDEHPVLGFQLFEERPHLPGARQAGLVQHIKVAKLRASRWDDFRHARGNFAACWRRCRPRGVGPRRGRWVQTLRPCTRFSPRLRGCSGARSFSRFRPALAGRERGRWN